MDSIRSFLASMVPPVVGADPIGAGIGEHVLVAFGKSARVACGGDGDYAYEAAVVGIVDDANVPEAPASWGLEELREARGV